MAYSDFSLAEIETRFGLTAGPGELFPELAPVPVPGWLTDLLQLGRRTGPLVSEKARSEFLVAPILLALPELVPGDVAIFSGQRLDVDADLGLVGECDFILALTPAVPLLRAPLVTILEAKKGDVEAGIEQCVAQMVGARLFNERSGRPLPRVFGCVTSGEVWQYLRLEEVAITLDPQRGFIDNVGGILAVLREMLRSVH